MHLPRLSSLDNLQILFQNDPHMHLPFLKNTDSFKCVDNRSLLIVTREQRWSLLDTQKPSHHSSDNKLQRKWTIPVTENYTPTEKVSKIRLDYLNEFQKSQIYDISIGSDVKLPNGNISWKLVFAKVNSELKLNTPVEPNQISNLFYHTKKLREQESSISSSNYNAVNSLSTFIPTRISIVNVETEIDTGDG